MKDFEHVQDPQKYTSVFLDSFIAPDRAGGRGWGQEGSSWGHSQQGQQGMVAVHGKEAIQARLFFFFFSDFIYFLTQAHGSESAES